MPAESVFRRVRFPSEFLQHRQGIIDILRPADPCGRDYGYLVALFQRGRDYQQIVIHDSFRFVFAVS